MVHQMVLAPGSRRNWPPMCRSRARQFPCAVSAAAILDAGRGQGSRRGLPTLPPQSRERDPARLAPTKPGLNRGSLHRKQTVTRHQLISCILRLARLWRVGWLGDHKRSLPDRTRRAFAVVCRMARMLQGERSQTVSRNELGGIIRAIAELPIDEVGMFVFIEDIDTYYGGRDAMHEAATLSRGLQRSPNRAKITTKTRDAMDAQ